MTRPVTAPPSTRPGGGWFGRWWEREVERLAVERPRLLARLRWVAVRPVVVLLPLAAVVFACLGAAIPGGDAGWFRRAGMAMWGPHVLDTFAEPGLQIGPLYLAALGAAARVVAAVGLPPLPVLSALQAVLITWFGIWTAGRLARAAGAAPTPAAWATGLVLVVAGYLTEGIANGHPEELLIALLLANAALDVTRGHWWRGGLLLGLATGVKQWAPFTAGALVRGNRVRGSAQAAVAALSVTAVLYLPFVLGGDVRTFDFSWGISDSSVLGTIASWAGLSDWGARVVQGGVAGLAGLAVAWRGRFSPLVPLVVAIAVRLLLDPLRLSYYSGPLMLLLVLWAWSVGGGGVRALVLSLASPAVVFGPYVLSLHPQWTLGTIGLVLVVVALPVLDRRALRARAALAPADTALATGPATGAEVPRQVSREA